MKNLSSYIDQSLRIYAATEGPNENADADIYSIYCPKSLVEAYKEVCEEWGISHADMTRRLIAEHVLDCAKDLAYEEQMGAEAMLLLERKLRGRAQNYMEGIPTDNEPF